MIGDECPACATALVMLLPCDIPPIVAKQTSLAEHRIMRLMQCIFTAVLFSGSIRTLLCRDVELRAKIHWGSCVIRMAHRLGYTAEVRDLQSPCPGPALSAA